jgi:anionic cell wall polymer biosynthesis LytR-Cps2A-Psr (LCP) family protein
MKNDRIIKVLFVIEDKNAPLSSQVLMFYPVTRRSAVFDIPSETGKIIKSLGRVDQISALFKPNSPHAYRNEIGNLLGTDISLTTVISLDSLAKAADLLDGLEIFVPNAIDIKTPTDHILFPSGTLKFDGDKVRKYFTYVDPAETEDDLIQRRQKCFLSFLKRVSERSDYILQGSVYRDFSSLMNTNLSQSASRRLISILGTLDMERVTPSRVQGNVKTVGSKQLLFPYYDGELLKDIVKQNLNALVNISGTGEGERVFTMEILNGTPTNGLARKAASLYESFGYEVLTTKNADSETAEKTVIYDRANNPAIAQNIASIIKCKNTQNSASQVTAQDQSLVDFTIVLGKDFNGRYCQ